MSTRRFHKPTGRTSPRKRIALAGAVAAVVAGAMFVVQNSFAATIPGFGSRRAATATPSLPGLSFPSIGGRTNVASTGDAAGNCPDAHIIVTRASTEAPGTGIIGSLATAVTRASDQTITVEATDYPALLNPYPPSVAAGTRELTSQLTTEVANCPNTKIVMMGYSQGAHVIGDVLAGTGRVTGFTQADAVSTDVTDRVVAVILMGDPRYVPGKSFNAGTSRTKGLFARGEDASLDAFADRTQSYCDTGDTFCASGASVAVHLSYTQKYNNDAEDFILSKIGG
ncbi:cutinase family protein [Actinoplanes sp. NPDC051851]|uniref:cutinase family protein n=1 Tax=Actinoplanes sp. NPDC051851 TaxID=3154753 RepID=UPI0034386B05